MNMKLHNTEKSIIMKLVILLLLSVSWAVLIAFFITGHFWQIDNIHQNLASFRLWTGVNRAYILFFVFFYLGLHFVFPVKKIYTFLFRKRWLIGFLLLVFLTLNRYHGDSISYYNELIQPGMGDASGNPIIGKTRDIRSDEFIGTAPSILASGYGENPYGKYNEIVRGTKTLNMINGIYFGYCTVAYAPWNFVYSFMPVEYAFSFCWYAPLILGFLITLELFYIISQKDRILSVAGAFLVIFSSWYLWWTFSTRILSTAGTIVCLYYFLNNTELKKKFFCGLGTALCFANFIITLYPAWQIPFGYMFLAIGVWLIHDNWSQIKALRKRDWLILGISIAFCLSLIVSYFYTIEEYASAIANTSYPGARVSLGGGAVKKLFLYAQAPFYAYEEIGNPSEAGVFFSLFPIPSLMALYCWIKEKKKDWLTGGLLLAQVPMIIYVSVGFPKIIALVSLFSRSTASRVVDIIGLIQIYFIVILLSRYKEIKKLPVMLGIVLGVIVAGGAIWISNDSYPEYLNGTQKVIMFFIISICCYCLLVNIKNRWRLFLMYLLIGISIFTGIYIRPVVKGLDAINSKPVAKEIKKICESESNKKWMTMGVELVLPAYSVACGAPTVNSVNLYPNMELWEKLDPARRYEDVYNRYAHIIVRFTNETTSFEERFIDQVQLNLSYKDIEKTEISYLLVAGELQADLDNGYVEFEEIYKEGGVSIYRIKYLN